MNARVPPEEFRDEHQPFLRLPGAVTFLAIVLLGIHAVLTFVPPSLHAHILLNYAFFPERYSPEFLAAHGSDGGSLLDRALPFVTYIFLHANWTHVVINTLWLLAFAPVVARRFGAFRFFDFFLICGVAGAVCHLALNWGSADPVVGASAAVSGLMGAAFRLMGREGADGRPAQPMAPLWSRPVLAMSAVWVGVNIVAGVLGLGAGPGFQTVAWQAHLGGFFAGLLLAGLFDPFARLNPDLG